MMEETYDGPKDRPYKFMVFREFWNGRKTVHHTDKCEPNTTILGMVKEDWRVDTRYEARLRLWNYINKKRNEAERQCKTGIE